MKNKINRISGKRSVRTAYSLALALVLLPSIAVAGTIYTCQTSDGRLYKLEQPCGKYKEISRSEPKVTAVKWVNQIAQTTPMAKAKNSNEIENVFAFARSDQSRTYRTKGFIENLPVDFVIDTGATSVAIPTKLAEWAGIGCMKRIRMSTANGTTTACTSMIKNLHIGEIVLHDVEAVIAENLSEVLLGQSALRSLKVEQQGGVIKLSAPTKHTLASAHIEQP